MSARTIEAMITRGEGLPACRIVVTDLPIRLLPGQTVHNATP